MPALFITFVLLSHFLQAQEFPELDPAKIDLGVQTEIKEMKALIKQAPNTEWTLHKTSDGSHPDGNGKITLYGFVSGFAPHKEIFMP